ncbi:MAG: AAA-like domain-containing protein [Fimbriimonadaceae bacterium]|nr:AAA-like domain-containing protein [Fimbriimonadaceae bacterium]
MNGNAAVSVQMLGGLRVSTREPAVPPKFRSRTAERLLSRLALRLGKSVAKSELMELLWPESDGDRQAQNLRRALADVRQALEEEPGIPLIVHADHDHIWLDPERVQTDVAIFKQTTDAGLEGSEEESNLRSAFQLYTGRLLPDDDDPRIGVYRMELEELFAQTVEQLIALLLRNERHDEALRVGRHAVTVAPLREDVHVALMRAYASAGLRSQAIRQFEELETLLDDQWGEPPSAKSVKALESLAGADPTGEPSRRPTSEVPAAESAGGAVPAGSPFYIARDCDGALRRAIGRRETTILVHGARQVGKTSLLGRVLNEVRRSDSRVAITDFQVLSRSQLATADAFCRAIAYGFSTQLGADLNLPAMWNEWLGPNSNLDAVVESALAKVEGPVVWAMDETDRLFGTVFADDFFGLVRSWHNRRAMEAEGPFNKLTLVIAYATEAHLFIKDINQSPFNVGVRIPMRDFGEAETRELSLRYGTTLKDSEVRRLANLTGGQPFLTRRALDALVLGGTRLDDLEANAAQEDGPFGEHLRRLLDVLDRDEPTKDEVRRLLRNQPFRDAKSAHRLIAGGMLVRKSDGALEFRVPAYRDFLGRSLDALNS